MNALGDAEERYKKRHGIKSTKREATVKWSRKGASKYQSITHHEDVPSERDPQLAKTIQRLVNQAARVPRKPGELPLKALAKMATEVLEELGR